KMGLRPYLSLKPPITGAAKNCTNAYENISHPPYSEASLSPSPLSSIISFGKTGIIIPRPITSIKRVTKINPTAAFFLFMVLGCQICFNLSKQLFIVYIFFMTLNRNFKTPCYAVIFSYQRSENLSGYQQMDEITLDLVKQMDGFL